MSTEPKSPKPMPSADEINAYLELSAARTRLRLPLAKGNAAVVAAATPSSVEKSATRALPLSATKKLSTGHDPQGASDASESSGKPPTATHSPDAVWHPFSDESER